MSCVSGEEGENWEDIYSTYIKCAEEWRVHEKAAFRNIENVLTGEAKTYYKRKMKADPSVFKCCSDVYRFIKDTFHGQESQEATLEHLDSLSMSDKVRETGSVVAGLKAIREEMVKHVNLVPENRQNEAEQKRWLKRAVRMYSWARPTTARTNELDFAKMYATLRAQAIEEENSTRSRAYGGKIGDKSLGQRVWFGDTYGRPKENPKARVTWGKKEAAVFRGSCFVCGKQGFKRSDCPNCKGQKPDYRSEGSKALKAINEVQTLTEAAEVLDDLTAQYGEAWDEVLGCGEGEGKDPETDEDIGFTPVDEPGVQTRTRNQADADPSARSTEDESFVAQYNHRIGRAATESFEVMFCNDVQPNDEIFQCSIEMNESI